MAAEEGGGREASPCSSASPPSRPPPPSPAMGCAASATDRAERQRRGRALGHSETSTTGLLVTRQRNDVQQESMSAAVAAARRRGCKVAPEPKEDDGAAALAMPGSPSFRFYCQKSAAVDALVADADGGDSDGFVKITETPQAIKNNGLPVHDSSEFSKPEASRWIRFRGLAVVAAAVCSLFTRHSSAASAPAKSHHRCAASDAAAPAPAARSAHL